MTNCACIGGLLLIADAAAWVLSAQTGDSRWAALVVSGTTIVVSICGAIIFLAPHVAKALTAIAGSIYPALALIRKQNEEINKGTLSERIETLLEQNQKLAEQNEKLQATIEDDRESTEKARKTLHEIRGEFQVATLQHTEQRAALIAQVGALTESLEAARREIAEGHRREQAKLNTVAAGKARQDVVIEEVKAMASETKAATEVNAAAIGETQAAIERLGGGTAGEGPEGQG